MCVWKREGETERYVKVKKWEATYRASDEGEERTMWCLTIVMIMGFNCVNQKELIVDDGFQ